MAKKLVTIFRPTSKKKRKGVHSKNNNKKKKYRGQGR
tara:strand:+ start:3536 stop:3646 length:111 start_codon:yes stop_codon:yes gene_type:complete